MQAAHIAASATPAAEPTVATAEPTAAAVPATTVTPLSGVLAGSNAGNFTRFMVTYDTNAAVTLDMYYSPSDNLISKGVEGFHPLRLRGFCHIGGFRPDD